MTTRKLIASTIFAGSILALAAILPAYAAPANYPIEELGNCRDQTECYQFCNIPAFRATCWSYSQYILGGGQVLGETTDEDENENQPDITFPIEELGNCSDVQSCKIFCDDPENHESCLSFAQEHGLRKAAIARTRRARLLAHAKEELGCQSVAECRQMCAQPENHDTCTNILRVEVTQRAQEVLGCSTFADCREFCSDQANKDACQDFLHHHAPQSIKKHIENRRQDLLKRLPHLPCDSFEACQELCAEPEYTTRCRIIANERGVPKFDIQDEDFTCNTASECRRYCLQNPDKCPGFEQSQDYQRFQEEQGRRKFINTVSPQVSDRLEATEQEIEERSETLESIN